MADEPEQTKLDLLGELETLAADEFVERAVAQLPARSLLLNFVSTVDGLAAVDGRSGPIGGPADRAVFHALRGFVDAVMVGAGTARREHYGPLVRDERVRATRERRGLAARPLAIIVSRSLELPVDLPLLADPHSEVVVVTNGERTLDPVAARVSYIRTGGADVDLGAALSRLRDDYGAETILCEGGPTLAGTLMSIDAVEELWLTIGPRAAGTAIGPRILQGPELGTPRELELRSAGRCGDELFLRYGVASAERISRMTTD